MDLVGEDRLLIDGELVAAEAGRTYDTVNPATEEVLGTAPGASVGDAERSIAAARRAFETTEWSQDPTFRMRCLGQLHEALTKDLERLRAVLVNEVGAPVSSTSGPQLGGPIDVVRWYADLLEAYEFVEDLGERDTFAGRHHRWIEKEAAGVVGAITAYNYPIQLALAKLAPALAAGCTVVLKGAPDAPWSTLALGRLVAESTDIPDGVVNVLASPEAAVGAVLTTHPDVDVVSFTGSTPVGRQIMAAASETVKRVFLELGGKSALVLLDDGDPAMAALMASYATVSHSGQGCAITSRLVVPRARFDEVVDAARAMLADVAYGDPQDPATMMGPLINARQRDKVAGYVDRAVADGADAVIGGRAPEHLRRGFFYEPTLLVGAGEDSAVAQDELFGPVLVVLPHDGDDDAVRIANRSIYGLSGSVMSADRDRALAVARRIRAGTISVNGGLWYGPDAPFGGYKQSGMGREMGEAGLDEFLERKTLAEPAAP
ncbi:MAG TPA: aldehyde dehydrogenase family protein [Acidimicrobiia bacterium]|nr:aldehyde dehydrogenase family protein [Acidimicrobiia bacterium]